MENTVFSTDFTKIRVARPFPGCEGKVRAARVNALSLEEKEALDYCNGSPVLPRPSCPGLGPGVVEYGLAEVRIAILHCTQYKFAQ